MIEKDRISLEKLGISHQQLAFHLGEVVELAKEKGGANFENIEVAYRVSPELPEQTLLVQRRWFCGYQYSFFWNEELDEGVGDNTKWNTDYIITNKGTNLSLTIAGDKSGGVLQFIEKYGFFEGGGAENEYRVEPALAVFILAHTSHKQVSLDFREVHLQVQAYLSARNAAIVSGIDQEISQLQAIPQSKKVTLRLISVPN